MAHCDLAHQRQVISNIFTIDRLLDIADGHHIWLDFQHEGMSPTFYGIGPAATDPDDLADRVDTPIAIDLHRLTRLHRLLVGQESRYLRSGRLGGAQGTPNQ